MLLGVKQKYELNCQLLSSRGSIYVHIVCAEFRESVKVVGPHDQPMSIILQKHMYPNIKIMDKTALKARTKKVFGERLP